MPVYLIGLMDVTDPDEYANYGEAAALALAPFAGHFRPLAMTAHSNPVIYEGECPAGTMFIIEFESRAVFEEFYKSKAYQEARQIRLGSSVPKALMVMEGISPAG